MISVLALFIALGGSAVAVQVAKKNSVTSKSIRNNAVRSVDLKNGQVKGADIGDGQVGSPDIGDGQVGSPDVADGSLSATDIDVNSLGDATTGDSKIGGVLVCEQNSTNFQECFSKELTLERAGRIFATSDGSADSGIPAAVGVNTCQMTVDGTSFTSEFVIAADFSPGEAFSFSGVTEPVAPGVHEISLQCKGNGTAPAPRIFFPTITTLTLGSG
ncbi:MAG: hypothetical protein ACSLFI_10445 [Solirubrobacterales bacterium]